MVVGRRANGTARTSARKLGESNLGGEQRGILKTPWSLRLTTPLSNIIELARLQGLGSCSLQPTGVEHFAQSPSAAEELHSPIRIFIGGMKAGGICGASLHMVGQVKVKASHVRGST